MPQITREGPTSQQSGQTTRELAKATLGNKVENMYAADPKTEQEIRACNFGDELFALQPAQIVGRLPTGVGRLEKCTNALDELPIGEARVR